MKLASRKIIVGATVCAMIGATTLLSWLNTKKISAAPQKEQAGQWVDPSLDSVTAAAAAALTSIPADLRFSIVDAPGDTAYSISTATWRCPKGGTT